MDNLQAAIGLERMKYLSLNNFKRLFLADRYITQLAELQNKGFIELPELSEDHVWHLFPIKVRTEDRADIMTKLNEDFGVQTDVYYQYCLICKNSFSTGQVCRTPIGSYGKGS